MVYLYFLLHILDCMTCFFFRSLLLLYIYCNTHSPWATVSSLICLVVQPDCVCYTACIVE